MSPEVVTAIATGALALIGSITAMVTAKVSANNSATKAELDDLRRRVDELKGELQIERDSNDKLRAQITAAEDSVVTAAAEKRELKVQMEGLKEGIAARDRQIKLQQTTINNLETKNKEQEARIKELESRVSEMEALMRGGKTNATS